MSNDISVIIPTCDRTDYLREAIESVLAQQLNPREILIIDNGVNAVDPGHMPPGVQVHRLPPRVGPSRARNFGVALATAPLVAFLDDDDWWTPGFLAGARSVLQSEQLRCVFGRTDHMVSDRAKLYKLPSQEDLTVSTLLRRNPGTGGTNLLIERQLFLEVGGFDERLRLSEDRALAIDILLAGHRIGIAPDAIAMVRHHAADRLRTYPWRKLRFLWKYRRLYSSAAFIAAVFRIAVLTTTTPSLARLRATGQRLQRDDDSGKSCSTTRLAEAVDGRGGPTRAAHAGELT